MWENVSDSYVLSYLLKWCKAQVRSERKRAFSRREQHCLKLQHCEANRLYCHGIFISFIIIIFTVQARAFLLQGEIS